MASCLPSRRPLSSSTIGTIPTLSSRIRLATIDRGVFGDALLSPDVMTSPAVPGPIAEFAERSLIGDTPEFD